MWSVPQFLQFWHSSHWVFKAFEGQIINQLSTFEAFLLVLSSWFQLHRFPFRDQATFVRELDLGWHHQTWRYQIPSSWGLPVSILICRDLMKGHGSAGLSFQPLHALSQPALAFLFVLTPWISYWFDRLSCISMTSHHPSFQTMCPALPRLHQFLLQKPLCFRARPKDQLLLQLSSLNSLPCLFMLELLLWPCWAHPTETWSLRLTIC